MALCPQRSSRGMAIGQRSKRCGSLEGGRAPRVNASTPEVGLELIGYLAFQNPIRSYINLNIPTGITQLVFASFWQHSKVLRYSVDLDIGHFINVLVICQVSSSIKFIHPENERDKQTEYSRFSMRF